MRKVVLAFDSYKGCMSAHDACCAAADGIRDFGSNIEVTCIPMSDGGEGLVECVSRCLPLQMVPVTAHDPLMKEIRATYGISSDGSTAYMEMAAVAGLELVPIEKRNPMIATTWGVGEMLLDAKARGCQRVVMGIGGSATCDGGKGMVDALDGNIPLGLDITVACDVTNPLYGKQGAAFVFAPQKGATPEQVELLDKRLREWGTNKDIALMAGAGAAGGLGYGLVAFLGAKLRRGVDIMLDIMQFDDAIRDADLIITGEGKSDKQTLMGKVAYGVLTRAKQMGIPVCLLSGSIEDKETLTTAGFANVKSINEGDDSRFEILMQREVAMNNLRRCVHGVFADE